MSDLFNYLQHLDQHLAEAVQQYGLLVYALLAAILFCETGLIITSFLPGDSLLFTAGSLAAAGVMHPSLVLVVLPLACFLGDQANFWLGRTLGTQMFHHSRLPGFSPQNLRKAESFFDRYGGRTILFGRFLPVIRSIVPFVAAASGMKYASFLPYSFLGAAAWSYVFLLGGFLFGNLPFVQDHLWLVLLGVVALSVLPTVVQAVRKGKQKNA